MEGKDRDTCLAAALGGQVIAPGLLLIERRFDLSANHGSHPLSLLNQLPEDLPTDHELLPHQIVFLDTETTGLSGGSGTLAFLLGMARIGPLELKVRQLLLSRYCGERPMLEQARFWLTEGITAVTYNGSGFDLPLLTGRCRINGLPALFPAILHVDLLHFTRRAFSKCWDDCRLATVERQLLGYRRYRDLPGSQAPQAWIDWIQRQKWKALEGVCQHNRRDLLSLAMLLPLLSAVYRDPLLKGADLLSVVRGHLKVGREPWALGLLQNHRAEIGEVGQRELMRLLNRQERDRQLHLACGFDSYCAHPGSGPAIG